MVWTEAARRGLLLADVVRLMAEGPAHLVGLDDRGAIEADRQADFVVFAPEEQFVVDPYRLEHRNPVSPYDGRTLQGVVRSTWLRGHPITTDPPEGRLLSNRDHHRESTS